MHTHYNETNEIRALRMHNIIKCNEQTQHVNILHVMFDITEDSFISTKQNDDVFYNDLKEMCDKENIDISNYEFVYIHMQTNNTNENVLYGEYNTKLKIYSYGFGQSSRDFSDAYIKHMIANARVLNPNATVENTQDVDLCVLRIYNG